MVAWLVETATKQSNHRCKECHNHGKSPILHTSREKKFLHFRSLDTILGGSFALQQSSSSVVIILPLRPRITVTWSSSDRLLSKWSSLSTLTIAKVKHNCLRTTNFLLMWYKSCLWLSHRFSATYKSNLFCIQCGNAGFYLCLQRPCGPHIKQNALSPLMSQRHWWEFQIPYSLKPRSQLFFNKKEEKIWADKNLKGRLIIEKMLF